ncbi:MAG: hypothetical protein IJO29_01755 [Oscillospiraceae bacterium]|nr:hypothetical protein [Oscillospiraceae bacterium]
MKRGILILFSIICLMMNSFSACSSEFNAKECIASNLDINTDSAQVNTVINSSRNFHGDGHTFISLGFADNPITDEIKQKENWKQLPLTDNLTSLVYGKENVYNGITNDDDELLIPQIENGYYYFENRHSDAKNRYGDSDVFDLVSYNYTIAIYDEDENILYFYSLDT